MKQFKAVQKLFTGTAHDKQTKPKTSEQILRVFITKMSQMLINYPHQRIFHSSHSHFPAHPHFQGCHIHKNCMHFATHIPPRSQHSIPKLFTLTIWTENTKSSTHYAVWKKKLFGTRLWPMSGVALPKAIATVFYPPTLFPLFFGMKCRQIGMSPTHHSSVTIAP